jgi:putative tryptophan/tyrosine transport system substrate-binding protein
MRRRDFITLLGGTAAAWPLEARTQQLGKIFRIGYLGASSPSLERPFVDALLQTLRERGRVEGKDIVMEYRWAEGRDDRLPNLASDLVRTKPDVIVTTGTPGTLAAKQATNTIPIVFASSGNPINAGLVASLERPGGNVTGFTISGPELEGKRVQLLKEAVPSLSRLAMLWNSANPVSNDFYQLTRTAAAALALTLQPITDVRQIDDFDGAFSTIAGAKADAMIVTADRFLLAHRTEIVNFASTNRLPTMYAYRAYVEAGGLMSYAPSDLDQFHRAAVYVDDILKGSKAADLPVQEPTRFELVINLKTAKALGLTVLPSLLAIADEVIE